MTGVDVLHLGCGTDYHSDAWNVDVVDDVNPDQVVDLEEMPWPWRDRSWREIRAYHVFEHLSDMEAALRECERILEAGGCLEVRLPVGLDATADPDHSWGENGNPWGWRTPLFYCGLRHWDRDVGLDVVSRDVELWPAGQTNVLAARDKVEWWLRRRVDGPGPWCFNQPGCSGEFTVVFKKP